MAITVSSSNLYWNYFLALEKDMEQVARFIEFAEPNFKVYSIELAHLLFAASSEVDVIAKALCKLLSPTEDARDIRDYRRTITTALSDFAKERVQVSRFGLTLDPWSTWRNTTTSATNPTWWKGYNNVKHQRNDHFADANLKHALNSLAGLLVMEFFYHRQLWIHEKGNVPRNKDITNLLEPNSTMFRLKEEYYVSNLVS